ncbi:tRNA (guanosine(37)-N1)-methyltransferase TrmD [Sulfuriflexus sp.]|uniref:tRNA (guanosine(37)-N1)-methyltransferase TrmD n=1 Tax=Sulfuriflexus sp. TaxID=2015443 RepID=UPI0028CCA67F|nr:tRNA (guanosine(37)-N1)-methyltransferase TrmD [Sulfuriflexus sp.]MDT8403833.1 tRNA (guanosine(37)-N1)-methyltransferase TrmD [Sulfuriflexus sp.]
MSLQHIAVVTLFPDMLRDMTQYGVTGRALKSGIVDLSLHDPRTHAEDKHRTVDDRPYGGGPGMVMQVAPLRAALNEARASCGGEAKVIYLSPQGRKLDQAGVAELAKTDRLILIAGRYEGIDERLIESEVDAEWSIGDYVLSGGELAAAVIIDAVVRTLPGALGDDASAEQDSFVNGLLDYPHYTRPEEVAGRPVPKVLLSGDHAAIACWRLKQSLGRTWLRRPDLLEQVELSKQQQQLLDEFITEHNEH